MLLLLSLAAVLVVDPPRPPLTLADALALARRASPLREAPARLATAADDAARRSGRPLNPQVDLRVENLGPTGQSALPKDVFAVVNQSIEIGGKRRLRRELGGADRAAAEAQLGLADFQVGARTVHLYVEALRARLLLETLSANRDGLARMAATMRRRVEEGVAPEADRLRFDAEAARLDLELVHARVDLDRGLNELGYVIGLASPPDASQLVEPAVPPAPAPDRAALALRVAQHPDARLATARVDRARQARALEQARRRPDPLVTAGYKRTAGVDTAVAGIALTLPVFDGNGVAAARAEGDLRAAEAERHAVVGRLSADAASLATAAQVLALRASTVGRELVVPAEAVRTAAQAALREGTADVLKVLDAERVVRDASRLAVELRLDALAAALDARLAVGEEPLP